MALSTSTRYPHVTTLHFPKRTINPSTSHSIHITYLDHTQVHRSQHCHRFFQRENDLMEKINDADHTFYPAFCFKASPTHFSWVKMALADVHKLHKPKGYNGQKLFFYKNHPITFISVVGVIVARNEITRRTILTIDDGSGATLDILVLQADPKEKVSSENAEHSTAGSYSHKYPTAASTSNNFNITQNLSSAAEMPDESSILAMNLNDIVHVTATDRTMIDISMLVPGVTVKVKGTVSSFRSIMQMNLERFTLVGDTNAEMQFIDERLRFWVEVLSVPWVLSDEEVDALRLGAERDLLEIAEGRRRAEKRVRLREEREERDQRHIQKRYEKEERKRAKSAGVCKEDGVKIMHDIRRKRVLSGHLDSSTR